MQQASKIIKDAFLHIRCFSLTDQDYCHQVIVFLRLCCFSQDIIFPQGIFCHGILQCFRYIFCTYPYGITFLKFRIIRYSCDTAKLWGQVSCHIIYRSFYHRIRWVLRTVASLCFEIYMQTDFQFFRRKLWIPCFKTDIKPYQFFRNRRKFALFLVQPQIIRYVADKIFPCDRICIQTGQDLFLCTSFILRYRHLQNRY